MKKLSLLSIALLFSFTTTHAQNYFQGSIQFSFTVTGEGTEAIAPFMPTGMNLTVLNSDMRTDIVGGMVAQQMNYTLTLTDKNLNYMVSDEKKEIYVMDLKKLKTNDSAATAPVIKKEDETITIAGYTCQKYSAVMHAPGGDITVYLWVTDQFNIPKGVSSVSGLYEGTFGMKGIIGTPLKIMETLGEMTIVIAATSVSTEKPAKTLFKLPKGYKKKDFDPAGMTN